MKTSEAAFKEWAERLGEVSLGRDAYWKTNIIGYASHIQMANFMAHGPVARNVLFEYEPKKCVVFLTNYGQHYVPIVDMILDTTKRGIKPCQ